jgi:hypothetical protein
MQRYKTAAERCFQREYRQLEQHYKAHPPAPPEQTAEEKAAAEAAAAEAAELANYCPVDFTVEDLTSPTGVSLGMRSGGNDELDRKLGRKIYQRGDPYP